MSVEAYLALDRESLDTRYEYTDGYAYPLVGGTPIHSLIAANLIGEIKARLRGSSCQVYTSDAKVRLSHSRYVYPDVTVSCDERDRTSGAEVLQYPRLVIEILSRRGYWRTSADRKSTRLNSSHQIISYAVFCLKKKKQQNPHI